MKTDFITDIEQEYIKGIKKHVIPQITSFIKKTLTTRVQDLDGELKVSKEIVKGNPIYDIQLGLYRITFDKHKDLIRVVREHQSDFIPNTLLSFSTQEDMFEDTISTAPLSKCGDIRPFMTFLKQISKKIDGEDKNDT